MVLIHDFLSYCFRGAALFAVGQPTCFPREVETLSVHLCGF